MYGKTKIITVQTERFKKIISNSDLIKIDVEGHETEVIKGSERTIKNNKPILLVEIEEQYTQKKVEEKT